MTKLPAVIVFARAPRPGATKTRLIPALGPEGAADLYRCFLLDTLSKVGKLGAAIVVEVAEADDAGAVAELSRTTCPEARIAVQKGRDLGARMAEAVETTLFAGHPRAVVIGTDSPSVPLDLLRQALDLGGDRDLVLGPCLDGGYYLIGMREAQPEVFAGIQWSSATVLSETLKRAEEQSLTVALLEPWYDVDTPEDLLLLQSHLEALASTSRPSPCPRTWSYLRGLAEEQPA
jgi:rSAM/selenodomain-associated transferase 1